MNPNTSRQAMFPARFDALGPVNAFLSAYCRDAGIGREPCLRANLILEELFTNTVKYGHRGECAAPVWIMLDRRSPGLRITYEDTAPPFNPFAGAPEEPLDAPVEDRKVGGLGILLTREYASSIDYAYLYGRNRIELSLDA